MSEVMTYRDAVEHLLDVFQVPDSEDRVLRLARRAVDNVYRDIPHRHRWSYFDREYVQIVDASYSTGTIEYDHTGGTNEREVTLTGGTWPANAAYGVLVISDIRYKIDRRISDTVVTLKSDSNPGADISSGTAYTYMRDAYALPTRFRKLGGVWDMSDDHELSIVGSELHVAATTVFYDSPDTPRHVSIRGSHDLYGRLDLIFVPPPSSIEKYRVSYLAEPRPITLENYSAGTVTTSGTSVTLSGGTLPETVGEGTVIRFSGSTTAPTTKYGNISDTLNRYYAQRHVVSRDSGTTLTIDSALDSDQTGVAYTLSDPIDFEPGAMMNVFLRGIEAEFARMAVLDNRRQLLGDFRQTLIEAMESDSRAVRRSGRIGYDPFSRVSPTTDV